MRLLSGLLAGRPFYSVAWLELSITLARYDLGDLDGILADGPRIDAEVAEQGATAVQLDVRAVMLRANLLRGHDPGAERLASMRQTSRQIDAAESLTAALGTVAAVRLMLDDAPAARRLLAELVGRADVGTMWWYQLLPTLVRTAIAAGDVDLASAILDHVEPQPLPMPECWVVAANAAILQGRGELDMAREAYEEAIRRCDALQLLPDLAYVLLGHGRTLLALGRPEEARPTLQRARGIFVDLQAAPALREVDAALNSMDARPARA